LTSFFFDSALVKTLAPVQTTVPLKFGEEITGFTRHFETVDDTRVECYIVDELPNCEGEMEGIEDITAGDDALGGTTTDETRKVLLSSARYPSQLVDYETSEIYCAFSTGRYDGTSET